MIQPPFETGLMWFRRDLRIVDNAALSLAIRSCRRLHCVFIFDRDILDLLPRHDRRVEFIRESVVELDAALQRAVGSGLMVRHARAITEMVQLANTLKVNAVFAAHDDEPIFLSWPLKK